MPPRKRAVSASKPDPDETVEPVTENDEKAADEQAPVEPEGTDASDSGTPTDPASDGDTETKPELDDIQADGEPCLDCFPGGWAAKDDIVGAVGCEHGTWQRKPAH